MKRILLLLSTLVFVWFGESTAFGQSLPQSLHARIIQLEDERNLNGDELAKLLKHASPKVRERAALAIGRIGDKRGTAALIELLQIEKARKLNVDEAVYFEIIRQKTASLIASCTEVGAASARPEDADLIERMRLMGEKIGMAFQIRDDLFDYGTDDVGKPLGIDIKEKKMTLPLIHVLNKSSWAQRRRIINVVRRHNTDKQAVDWLIQHVKDHGGISYSEQVMNNFLKEAMDILDTFPDSPSKTSMRALVDYSVAREK